jgi:thioredoxin 1
MQTLESINQTLNTTHDAVMLYFSAPTCNVCHALKPKLTEAIMDNFPTFVIESIDISETPEIASHFSVFAIPTVLIFFQGREFLRKSRHMSVGSGRRSIVEAISRRPYTLMVGKLTIPAVTATLSDSTPRCISIDTLWVEARITASLTPSVSLPNTKMARRGFSMYEYLLWHEKRG